MALKVFLILTLLTINNVSAFQQGDFIGCYQDLPITNMNKLNGQNTPKDCTDKCLEAYYRYALMYLGNECLCTNLLGEQKASEHCETYCPDPPDCTLKTSLKDVYFTGFSVFGPPNNLTITNITDTKLHISWAPPDYTKSLIKYKIQAEPIQTYSKKKLDVRIWEFSNETLHTELNSLQPGTVYNISIRAMSFNDEGVPAYQGVEMDIGEPSNTPVQPVVINRDGMTMKIELEPIENDNGPVSSYLIAVVNRNSLQEVEIDNLKGFREAHVDGLSYYITGELQKERIAESTQFVVGDGKSYGKYYNAPLEVKNLYSVLLGVTSRKNGQEKILYSKGNDNDHNTIVYVGKEKESAVLVIALSVGIAIVSVLLLAGIILFVILRQRTNNRFRHRLQDAQELTMQGPMIDIENSGYISEEQEEPTNHYRNLKGQVWMIPHNSLNVDNTLILGEGKYGHIHKGILEKDNALAPVSVYNIADRRLTHDQKHNMLKDMDATIKAGKHPHVLEFIGTCENIDTVSIIFENSSLTLKEFLIGSRIPSTEKFTTMMETQAVNFGIDIAKALNHLHSKKILHSKICARHVAIATGNVPKLTGFGLTAFYKDGKSPNCLRWTAREVLKGQNFTYKSDVWSYGCLLWEICTLGATPYTKIPNDEIVEKVTKGLILDRPVYMDESLYQILLNCWQMNLDERPNFSDLLASLQSLRDDRFTAYLSFKLFAGFKYEPLQINQELNNSVF